MKKKVSRVELAAYYAIMNKSHSHRSKKDYDRSKEKRKLKKQIDSV